MSGRGRGRGLPGLGAHRSRGWPSAAPSLCPGSSRSAAARHGDVVPLPGLEVHVMAGEERQEVAMAVRAAAGQRGLQRQAQRQGQGLATLTTN